MDRYFKWISLETKVCKIFQKFLEEKRWYKSFLKLRENKQAPIDFLWRLYDKTTWKTIVELAVEIRTLKYDKEHIEKWIWYISFPISKLNELMKFWRMWKEVYIVYLLNDKVYFLNFDYYLKHNFEILKSKDYILKLPIKIFHLCE